MVVVWKSRGKNGLVFVDLILGETQTQKNAENSMQ